MFSNGLNFRWAGVVVASLMLSFLAVSPALAVPEGEEESWTTNLKDLYFEGVTLEDGSELISMDTPYRAMDPAVVPLMIKFSKPQAPDSYIKKVTLIIDENPAPVGGVFHLTPEVGDASLTTRIRINEYTYVRVIAETSDGKHYMIKNFVKASGGCAAPGLKDRETAMARLGKMKMKFVDAGVGGAPGSAQLMVSHPNYSGLQLDQVKGMMIPSYFVNSIVISRGDKELMSIEGDISLSENPSVLFHFTGEGADDLNAVVTDSEGGVFKKSWPIPPRVDG
ncbi:MAG: quinoprotein dehydrogenase-associated SoxYZ-like carrier [Rhodospirillaceae bacterium]|nr:quinoprotein dehydrogenase-associated SoxYZ-like carrier [Rhodospirillaceae bacterium]